MPDNRWRITPQYEQSLADPVSDVFRRLEDEILRNIARHFKGGTLDRSSALDWQARKLAQLGRLTQENIALIARYAKEESGLTAIALQRVLLSALQAVDPDLKQAAEKGLLSGEAPPMDEAIQRQLNVYIRQAQEKQNLVNTSILSSSLEQFRAVVYNAAAYERQIEEAQRILNAGAASVITGVSSRQQAVRKAVRQMANNGLTGFTDSAGRRWTPEAYVNMTIRTTAHRAATEAVFSRCDDYGASLIEVSAHLGARPRCAPFQGRVFDRNNSSGTVRDLNGHAVSYAPWSSTSYGEAAGLLGVNCGHFIYPFIPEYSVQTWEPTQDMAENNRLYEQSQKQRKIERSIRAAKREAMCLRAAGDDAGAKEAETTVRKRQAAMRDFLAETGRARRRDREQVEGYR